MVEFTKTERALFCDDIRTLMAMYDEWRAKWISHHDSSDGFDAWFSEQVDHGLAQSRRELQS